MKSVLVQVVCLFLFFSFFFRIGLRSAGRYTIYNLNGDPPWEGLLAAPSSLHPS